MQASEAREQPGEDKETVARELGLGEAPARGKAKG